MTSAPLIEVEDLRIDLDDGRERVAAVEGISFRIDRGETFGLVGESGCGKSITALALIGLLRQPLSIGAGVIRFDGREIQHLSAAEQRELRGNRIAMIFQEPMTALNPVSPVGRQIAEMFVLHKGKGWREANKLAVEALASVRVPAPERRVKDYPHQLSGGMRQRVMIAIALACGPDLLIADEPTTALDVTVQAEIIELMRSLCAERGTAILMISHDLGLVANVCRRVAVMYAGRIVEERGSDDIFRTSSHPYTQGLVDSLPRLGSRAALGRTRLTEIAGVVPAITDFPDGCRFNPRCTRATEICRTIAPETRGWRPAVWSGVITMHEPRSRAGDDVILSVEDLAVHFPIGGGLFGGGRRLLRAVDGVDLKLKRGECLGLVGESGCGKSTVALVDPGPADADARPHRAGRAGGDGRASRRPQGIGPHRADGLSGSLRLAQPAPDRSPHAGRSAAAAWRDDQKRDRGPRRRDAAACRPPARTGRPLPA